MRELGACEARRGRTLGFALTLALTLGGTGLAAAAAPPRHPPQTRQDLLTARSTWHDLIQGHSTPGLRGWKHPGLPKGWTVRHGVLSKSGPVEDLESTRKYRDFELEWQWKIGKAGNSGVFYRARHEYNEIYWTGPEYQLVDDAHTDDGKHRVTAAGSVYAMYPSPAGVVHPYGHWNSARILVRGNHVEYWMNGRKIVDYRLESSDWKKRVAASKFARYPGYGRAPEGRIGIQGNHPGSVWIRDMRIRVLP